MTQTTTRRLIIAATLVLASLSSACQPRIPQPAIGIGLDTPDYRPSLTPFQPETATLIPTLTPSFTPLPSSPPPIATLTQSPLPSLWIQASLPVALQQFVPAIDGLILTDQPETATLRLEFGGQNPVSRWVYALVAPFPTLVDGVSSDDLQRSWQGELAGPFAGEPLMMDQSSYAALSAAWGEAAPGAVQLLSSEELISSAWSERPSWGIAAFEALEPRWKVLEVDGQSPLRKEFDPVTYPLAMPVSLIGEPDLVEALSPALATLPGANRDPDRLTTLVMTGVTALVRATAFTMERKGLTHPGEDVRDWLSSADILHISNEVPFAADCPFPNPLQEGLVFCSDPRYIELLEDIGTDVVELTGDHFADWGAEATFYTLDMYRERGWPYYGGGYNLEEGRQALLIEHNGTRLAFIGCNAKGAGYATATDSTPGAVNCDYSWMQTEIDRLRKEGILPVATFQHFEHYTYTVAPQVRDDFLAMAEAGAVIVSGSQAHQPQGMEFFSGSFIHYGLGNLFFDQFHMGPGTNRAFIDRHVFYEGSHIGTELLTIQFIDFARPRPMAAEERLPFLQELFAASGW